MARLLARVKSFLAAVGGVLLAILAGAGALYAICRRPDREREKMLEEVGERQADREKRTRAEERLAGEEAGQLAGREEDFQDAERIRERIRSGKLVSGGLIILLALATALAGVARAAETTTEGPYVPGDYATLRQYFLATWDLSERYRGLYLDAEQSVRDLQASNARLLEIVEEQRVEIEALRAELARGRQHGLGFGVTAGGLWTPDGPGVFLGGVLSL